MPTTTNMGFRYPALSNSPNVPQDIQNLASDVDTAVSALNKPPACFLVQQSAQTGWSTTVSTAVTFGSGSEVVDTDTLHDTGSNTSRIVIGKKLGWWQVSGVYCPAANANTTYARGLIHFNGTAINGATGGQVLSSASGFVAIPTGTVLVQATTATDYVELFGQQHAASGTLGTAVSAGVIYSSLTAIWVRAS